MKKLLLISTLFLLITTIFASEPIVSTNLNIKVLETTQDSVKIALLWDHDGANTTHYLMYGRNESSSYSVVGNIDVALPREFEITLKKGFIYYFRVTAVNNIGESNPSNEVVFDANPPATPTGLRVERR